MTREQSMALDPIFGAQYSPLTRDTAKGNTFIRHIPRLTGYSFLANSLLIAATYIFCDGADRIPDKYLVSARSFLLSKQ